MDVKDSVLAAIGNTPLIKLRRASEETGCTILGKAEFMNPGASVKDRAALGIITDAIDRGELRKGGLVVDGTAGNTGIGLTIVANALGLRTVIVIPETQSQEKKDTLRALGATLLEVPAVPYRNENNYVKVAGRTAERLAREHPHGAIFANQFDNVANREIHLRTTGPEIWGQTGGRMDGFVSAIGTGGTLAGVAMALRERNADITIALADVPGAAMHSYYTTGELKAEGSSITEGIGQGRVTANLEGFRPDTSYLIPDAESLAATFAMLKDEGLALGLSSGVNVAGAIRLARELGPGKTIVTMLCDPATRYQSRLFNPEFLRSKGLEPPAWLENQQTVEAAFA
jgi:cysteine synthase A